MEKETSNSKESRMDEDYFSSNKPVTFSQPTLLNIPEKNETFSSLELTDPSPKDYIFVQKDLRENKELTDVKPPPAKSQNSNNFEKKQNDKEKKQQAQQELKLTKSEKTRESNRTFSRLCCKFWSSKTERKNKLKL